VGKVSVDVQELGVDLVNIAGHKLYAPKGVGALYIREGITVEKFMHGASHESGKRAGTENVIFDVALGEASEVARLELEHSQKHTYTMATRLRDGLSKHFSDIRFGPFVTNSEF
jgi:cysteine desulfurase